MQTEQISEFSVPSVATPNAARRQQAHRASTVSARRGTDTSLAAEGQAFASGENVAPRSIRWKRIQSRLLERANSRAIPLAIVVVVHALMIAVLTRALVHEPPTQPPQPIEARLIEEIRPTHAPPPPTVAIESPPIDLPPPDFAITELAESSKAIKAAPTVAAPAATPAPRESIAPPRFDADYLSNPAPVYPSASRRLREQGLVLLRVRVTDEGQAAQVLVERTSGSDRLDRAAVQAVERWRFVPARRGAESIEAWVLVPIEFELKA
jgi:protein TonB